VWKRTAAGRVLHFYLAGINNQNFLMRDRETGTWWQQITGKAILGPLKGRGLGACASDELSFGLWKRESPGGQVLAAVARDQKEYDSKWEAEVAKHPVVISFPGTELKSRDLVVGLELSGEARAYPWRRSSNRARFRTGWAGIRFLCWRTRWEVRAGVCEPTGRLRDGVLPQECIRRFSAGRFDGWQRMEFQGLRVSGSARGRCLHALPAIKDYWFDWRNYHPETTVYRR